jgi:hypothetical protein
MSNQFDMFGDNNQPRTEAYARQDDPSTAKNAARKISFTDTERVVYNVLKETGIRMTSLCIMRYLAAAQGEKVWSVSPRLVPLWKKGAILKAGEMTVVGSNGSPSTLQAWIVNPDTLDQTKPILPIDPTPEVVPETNASFDTEGRFIKNCLVCGKEASFGVDFFPRKGRLGMWFCREHKPGPVQK